MDKIVAMDFASTLVKAEVVEEANELRSKVLERALPTKDEHGDSETLYKANRDFVEKLTGITSDMKIIKYLILEMNYDKDFQY